MSLKSILPQHTGWEIQGKHHPVINLVKNFFIPHAGNRYEPHFLRPKRLLWYGLTSLGIKLVVIVFVSVLPLYAWMTPDILREEANKIIALTNKMRLDSGLVALAPSPLLSEAAKNKAEDMLTGQYFAHTSATGYNIRHWLNSVGYKYYSAGENLAIGFGDAPATVNAWKASPSHNENLIGDFSETGVAVVLGNYKGQDTALVTQYLAQPIDGGEKEKDVVIAKKIDAKDSGIIKAVSDNQPTLVTIIDESIKPTEVATPASVLSAQIDNAPEELVPLEPVVLQTSPIDQYFMIKSHVVPDVHWVFNFSSVFYKLLMFLAIFALFLNIVIKIRQQNIKLISTSILFICLMVTLIIV